MLASAALLATSGASYAQGQVQPRSIVAPIIVPLLLSQDPGPAPGITAVTPPNGASNVELDNSTVRFDPATGNHYDVISATFSKPLSIPSVNNATFKVSTVAGDVPATVILDDPNSTAKLATEKTLALLTEYTATLTSGITDLFGQPITQTHWAFTTRDGTWLPTQERVDAFSQGVRSRDQRVAVNASGSAIAAWEQHTATGRTDVWASRYEPGRGWNNPELVEFDTEFPASNPVVAIDDSGNATVVWERGEGLFSASVMANRYEPGSGWGTPVLLEVADGRANSQQVASDAAGNVIAIWAQDDEFGVPGIWANVFSAGGVWSGPVPVETDPDSYAYVPQIAVNAAGVAFVVWEQEDDVEFVTHIWANRYAPGAGWGTPQLIETNDVEYATRPQVAVDSAGNAIAVWVQEEATGDFITNIWTNRFAAGGNWGAAVPLESDPFNYADKPQVAMNADGMAFAIWYQDDDNLISGNTGLPISNLWVNRYLPGSGWSGPALIEFDDVNDAFDPDIAIDAAGNALAVWESQVSTARFISARRFVAGIGWNGEPTQIGDFNSVDPEVAVDGYGNMLALWEHQPAGQGDQIVYNRFGGGGEPNGKLISETVFSDPLLGQCVREAAAANSWHFVQEVISFDCSGRGIRSLGGLQTFSNLEFMNLGQNQIEDVSVIERMRRLRILDIQGNPNLRNIKAMIGHPALDLVLLGGTGDGGTMDCADLDALSSSNNGVNVLPPSSCRQRIADVAIGDPALQACVQLAASRQQLSYVDELTDLNCERGTGFNQIISDLNGVQNFENLESINIDRSGVQDLSPLAGLAQLRRVDASSTFISSLLPLAGLPVLEVLTLKSIPRLYNDIAAGEDPTGISILSTMPSLREAYLGNKDYCPAQAQCVTGGGRMDCQTLDALEGTLEAFVRPQSCNMPLNQVLLEIEDLALRQCVSNTAAAAVPALVNTAGFTSLSCTFAGITSLKGLERFGRIKDLFLDGNPLQDLRPLNSIRTLERLFLTDTSVSSFDALSDLALLRVLDARRTPLTEVDELFRMARLGRSTGGQIDLSIGYVDLTDAGQVNGLGTLPCADLDRLQALVEANNIFPGTNFQPQGRTPDVCSGGVPIPPSEGRSADINNDGSDDLVLEFDAAETALLTANWITALSNSNQFVSGGSLPGISTGINTRARAVALGDANGDPISGDDFDDILMQLDSAFDDSVAWRAQLSDGAGGFGASTGSVSLPEGKLDNAQAIGFKDVNGDGNADILIQRQVTTGPISRVEWYLSLGDGSSFSDPLATLVATFNLSLGRPRLIALEDVNGDDLADLVYAVDRGVVNNANSYCLRVVLADPDQLIIGSTGQSKFCKPLNVSQFSYLDSASVADVSGSGRKELVLSFNTGAKVTRVGGTQAHSVFTLALIEGNNGFEATWGDLVQLPVIDSGTGVNVGGEVAPTGTLREFRTVAVADINNDRRSDILIEVGVPGTGSLSSKSWVAWVSGVDADGFPRFVRYSALTPPAQSAGYQVIGLLDYNNDVSSLPDILFQRTNPSTGDYQLLVSLNNGGAFNNPVAWYQDAVKPRVVGVEEDGLTTLANDTSELIAWVGVGDVLLTHRQFSDFLAGKGLTLVRGNQLGDLEDRNPGDPAQPLPKDACVINYSEASADVTRVGPYITDVGGKAEYGMLMCNVPIGDRVSLGIQGIYGGCEATHGLSGTSAKCEVGLVQSSLNVDLTPPPPLDVPTSTKLTAKGPNASACGGVSTKHVCGSVGAELAATSGSVSVGGASAGAKLAVGVGAGADMSIEDGVISGSIDLKFIVGGSVEFSLDPDEAGKSIYKVGRTSYTFAEDGAEFVVFTAGPTVYDAASKLGGAVENEANKAGKVVLTQAGQAVYFLGGETARQGFVVFTETVGSAISDTFNAVEAAAADAAAAAGGIIIGVGNAVVDGATWLYDLF